MVDKESRTIFEAKRCLVTGGAGALGSSLVRRLSEYGANVVVLDDLSSGKLESLSSSIEFIKGNILNDQILNTIFSEPISYVFHLAAHFANQNSVDHPHEDLMTNAVGTLRLLDECRSIGAIESIVYASSSCVLGNQDEILTEESRVIPETPYGFSKLAGEEYSLFYANEFGLPVTVIRYFNVYGPGEYPGKYRNVIPNFIDCALRNKPLVITGTGEETREFVYNSDAITGTINAALNKESSGEIFHMGSGERISISNLAKMIVNLCNSRSTIEYTSSRSWDHILHRETSIEKAQNILNYFPEIKLEQGLKLMKDWMRKNAGPY